MKKQRTKIPPEHMVGGYRARLQTLCDKAAPEARTVPYAEQAVRGAFDSTAEGI
jgi:hypothetical protein